MARKPRTTAPPKRLRNFNLGSEQAETDQLLQDAFYESSDYLSLEDPTDSHSFYVGRTGIGKSALLQRLEEEHAGHVIRINPEDLSLTYVANLDVIQKLSELDVHLDPLFIALWKHVLVIEIIKHRYGVNSAEVQQNFLQNLRERIKRDKSKIAALEYLEHFNDRFWCETHERVRDITTNFQRQIQAEASVGLNAKMLTASAGETSGETESEQLHVELVPRYQSIVNETQMPRLNQMIQVIQDNILDSDQHFTYVVIDDLDRDWVDSGVENNLIRCLFRAVMDLKRVRNLKVVVALRTNILDALDFGVKTGGQEEKFRALTVHMKWRPQELEAMLNERTVAAAARLQIEGVATVKDLLPAKNKTRGYALDYMTRRTLQRPRDVISYFNHCYSHAPGKHKISWETVHAVERDYSANRLLALRDEWVSPHPGLGQVFEVFSGAPAKMTQNELADRVSEVALLEGDESFLGQAWLAPLTADFWNGRTDDWAVLCHPIVKVLYKIGFLGLYSPQRKSVVYSYEDEGYGAVLSNLRNADYAWIHPAFRAGLDIRYDDDRPNR